MSGDVVDIATKSFYKSGGTVNSPNSTLTDIVNSLAGGLVTATSGSHGVITDFTNTSSPMYAAVNSFLPSNDPNTTSKPKAYLNWILLDDQFKGVSTYPQSGAIVVGSADVLNTLAYSGIPITKNGYLYIWVSNETPGWDVFFDNLSIKQYSGPITEETHYYPFGLTMAGISDKAISKPENKYKYSGKELQHQEFSDGSGLEEYDYGARLQDPQLGVWHNIDPLADKNWMWSPYNYVVDDPERFIDADGMDTTKPHAEDHDGPYGSSMSKEEKNGSAVRTYYDGDDNSAGKSDKKDNKAEESTGAKKGSPNGSTDGSGKPSLPDMKKNPPDHPGYKPPKSGPQWVRNPNGKGMGWLDKNGRVWVPDDHNGTHAPHWDVQEPKGGGYTPLYPTVSTVNKVGIGVTIGIGIWETIKWGAAILGAPETGGASLELLALP